MPPSSGPLGQYWPRVPVSIVCVYNEPSVLAACLERSVQLGGQESPNTELIAVDNREGRFASAGAALNHGATLASHAAVVFVHQDVFLHSLPAVEAAAARLMVDPTIGIAGAVGMDEGNRVVGRVRDRVIPIGESRNEPANVESLDEVLLMMRRDLVLENPISEDPLLAWHAYGVEYCARMRRSGRRAVAMNMALTHNSLSTNLKDLDLAHRRVGQLYPDLLPINTTCGVIGSPDHAEIRALLGRAQRVRHWLAASWRARRGARSLGDSEPVVSDIRMTIDGAAELSGADRISVLDVSADSHGCDSMDGLDRWGRAFSVELVSLEKAAAALSARPARELVLVTGLADNDLVELGSAGDPMPVVGCSRDTGLWLLSGARPEDLRPLWPDARNRPFGLRPRRNTQ